MSKIQRYEFYDPKDNAVNPVKLSKEGEWVKWEDVVAFLNSIADDIVLASQRIDDILEDNVGQSNTKESKHE